MWVPKREINGIASRLCSHWSVPFWAVGNLGLNQITQEGKRTTEAHSSDFNKRIGVQEAYRSYILEWERAKSSFILRAALCLSSWKVWETAFVSHGTGSRARKTGGHRWEPWLVNWIQQNQWEIELRKIYNGSVKFFFFFFLLIHL